MYDSKCYDLAEHFLPSNATEALKEALAQTIQNAVEDYCSEIEEDPTPWCNACGAKVKERCHCVPIADNE